MRNWDDLRIFLAVARFESLSAAGKQISLDPATIGRRIQRLEETIGAVLFVKSPQGYQLTDAGLRLLEHAGQAEQAFLAASDVSQTEFEGLTGSIRIGAPDGCANFILPAVCGRIADENPGLEIQIVSLPRVFNLSKREADMAIAVSPPTSGRLSVQKIVDYKLHLAAQVDYLNQAAELNHLGDLKQHRVIGYIPDMIFDSELDYLTKIGIERPELASNSVSVQFNSINAGIGVGIMHDFALPFAQNVRRLLMDQLSLSRSFYLIRHEDDRKVARFNRFAEQLVRLVREEVENLESKIAD